MTHKPGECLIDPDCDQGKHSSCVGGPCECSCHPRKGSEVVIPDRMTSHLSSMDVRHR